MYESLKGKKLLVIGSAEEDANIVRTAQDMGVYVIAVDGIKKSMKTFAKNIADESWDIDYSMTEEIGERCIQEKVDGVLAGYSEFRVIAACKIAKYIGKPFYASEEQINLTRNKCSFKAACLQYGVHVPEDYSAVIHNKKRSGINYPVIVKPADAAGRKGVCVCQDEKQLDQAIQRAVSYSVSKTALVERYIKGREYAAIYTLKDGKYSLSCFNEKYLDQECRTSGLCDLALTPSSYMEVFLKKADPELRCLLKGIHAENGVAFFQGIATEDDCYVFEMGYRLNGGNDYFIVERENGISYMKMLIAYSLTGRMEGNQEYDNPAFSKYYANFIMYAHAGEVETIRYTGDLEREGIEDIHIKKAPGMTIREDGTTQQGAYTFKLCANTLEGISDLIRYCQEHVEMKDINGNNMLFRKFDVGTLLETKLEAK